MSEDSEQSEKTEDPTQKRLDEATRRGQVITSREVNSFFLLVSLAFLIGVLAPGLMQDLKYRLSHFIIKPHDLRLDTNNFLIEMQDLMVDLLVMMIIPAAMIIAAIFMANAVQNRFVLSLEPIIPKFSKISPKKGLERLFSRRSFVEFLKGLIKIIIVGIVAAVAVSPYQEELRILITSDTYGLLAFIGKVTSRMMLGVCCIVMLIALLDYLYQRFEYIQQMRMTKQEIKDEYKQQEGDPVVKQRLRQLRRERVRNRMMEAVPESDVVITNPTHYAVAMKYDTKTMNAPIITAKGKDKVAQHIRELAEKNDVFVMRNPPLTRLLFDHGEVDEEIPLEYYQAVAQVIGYVYKIKGIDLSDKKL